MNSIGEYSYLDENRTCPIGAWFKFQNQGPDVRVFFRKFESPTYSLRSADEVELFEEAEEVSLLPNEEGNVYAVNIGSEDQTFDVYYYPFSEIEQTYYCEELYAEMDSGKILVMSTFLIFVSAMILSFT